MHMCMANTMFVSAKINLHRASPLASFTGLFCFRLLLCMAERYFGPRSLAPDTELDLFLFQHFGLGNQGNGEECEGFCESVTHKIQDRLCSRTAGNLLCILYLYVLWLDYRFLIESYDYCTAFDKHCIMHYCICLLRLASVWKMWHLSVSKGLLWSSQMLFWLKPETRRYDIACARVCFCCWCDGIVMTRLGMGMVYVW